MGRDEIYHALKNRVVNGSINPDYGFKRQEICRSGFSRDPGQELLYDIALKGTPLEGHPKHMQHVWLNE
jgi:hypothetical protein